MWEAFIDISNALAMSVENIIMLVLFLAGIIAAAKSFKIALIWWLTTFGLAFIGFYTWHTHNPEISYAMALTGFFMALVLLALSMYPVNKVASRGGFI